MAIVIAIAFAFFALRAKKCTVVTLIIWLEGTFVPLKRMLRKKKTNISKSQKNNLVSFIFLIRQKMYIGIC